MSRSERVESGVQVAIVVIVGFAAGAASFTHMHDWTMANSPARTPDWFGWANACISELVPIASLLEMRKRKRRHQSYRYPMTLLVAATALSLSAQLAVAKPGLSGGLLSAVPALAFMALVKLVLAGKAVPVPEQVLPPSVPRQPVPVVPAPRQEMLPGPVRVSREAPSSVVPEAEDRSRRTSAAPRTDEELRALLRNPEAVPRNPDGTVPIKRVVKLLGTGPDRARRLLDEENLRRVPVPA